MALLGLQLMGVLFVPTYLSLKKLLLFVKGKRIRGCYMWIGCAHKIGICLQNRWCVNFDFLQTVGNSLCAAMLGIGKFLSGCNCKETLKCTRYELEGVIAEGKRDRTLI